MITNFKQHIYPLISTTRKIFTILISIFLFGHSTNFAQKLSIVIVFASMGYELYDEIQSQEYHRKIRRERLKKQYEHKLSKGQSGYESDDNLTLEQQRLRKNKIS
jgi:hypothetical protein